ncbi:MAG: class I SAM-dependent methyltransferase [Micropepsaceae bacterium]
MTNGWEASAQAWIDSLGDRGDFGRQFVLDPVMLPLALNSAAQSAIDIGCGEGRFCRMLKQHGISATGIDPTPTLVARSRELDPLGTYVLAEAENLPVANATYDLVVSYLSLIDIPDIGAAILEMVRVLKPGGRLLIAHINAFNTAGFEHGWIKSMSGNKKYFALDRYMEERAVWEQWRGIRIVNHHRPLSTYMQLFLQSGLGLTHFSEPLPTPDAPVDRARDYVRVPWFCVMQWQKPSRP